MDADLVLEGGGVKGIGLVGAISVLEERGYTFHRVAGTSAGSIVGALVAAGLGTAELAEIMRGLDYQKFRDGNMVDHLGAFGRAMSLLFEQGVYQGDYLKQWLAEVLAHHGVATFGDLCIDDPGGTLPPERCFRLVVMASDLSRGRLARLPWEYDRYGLDAREVPVVDAVRASMSIPFFYEPVKLTDRAAGEETWLVDGGMLSNFPVDVFDRTDGQPPRWPTFGIKLSARPAAAQTRINRVHDTMSLTRAMVGTMTGFFDRMHLDDPAVVARTVFVDTMGVKSTDFDIDRATQQQLYDNGRRAAERFLDGADGQPGWDFEAYVARFRAPATTEPGEPERPELPRQVAAAAAPAAPATAAPPP